MLVGLEQKTGFCGDCDVKGEIRGPVTDCRTQVIIEPVDGGGSIQVAQGPGERGRSWGYSVDVGCDDDPRLNDTLSDLSPSQISLIGGAIKRRIATCEGPVDGTCPALCAQAVINYANRAKGRVDHLDRAAEY